METIVLALIILALAGVAIWYYNRDAQGLDINRDGEVNAQDAVAATKKAARGATRDARDAALAAAARSAGAVESVAKKAKTAARKASAKPAAKPAAKKATTTRSRSKK